MLISTLVHAQKGRSTDSIDVPNNASRGVAFNKQMVLRYGKSFFSDSRDYVTAPLSWNKKQVIVNSSLLAIGGGLFFADQWIHNKVPTATLNQEKGIKYGLQYFGNGYYTMPLMAGMFVYGLANKKERPFQTSLMGVKSFVISTVITRGLKYALNRSRPEANQGSNFWLMGKSPFSVSFPSGHTTGAFAIASVLARNYKDKTWVPITSYTIATGVAVSRLWTKDHWASDVFFGALVGWSVGTVVTTIDCLPQKSAWKVTPGGVSYWF